MKKTIVLLSAWIFSVGVFAQQAREEMKKDRNLSADNYVAYLGPQKPQTPAPKGYKPFYISHYGRHGSRYLIGTKDYDFPYFTLAHADSLGKLTPKGKETLRKLDLIRREANDRDGELTLRGAQQHKDIARRMYRNYPEVFAGKANIEARSTLVIRCILSMENALQQLLALNPQLQIFHDASRHDLYYMNQEDKKLQAQKMPEEVKEVYNQFSKKHDVYERVMNSLFNDAAYWKENVNGSELNRNLYRLASNLQSTELRSKVSLYDLFTDDELYDAWLRYNAWWYINYGPSPLNGGTQPYTQRNLLRTIIQQADSCIALPHPGATLRYGHDTMVMPLTCLLDLNGYGKQISDLEQLDKQGWCDYKIFPMASNLQFVFYRKSLADKDVLFKILLNENETTLPIKTDKAPYYHWNDFKEFYLKKLNAYDGK
ncbi:histidine-type phosphatase [Hoylesella saccharolytica]|uniref:histidine-type phosphatase n=1 Tax=Hoylesella saccharolytica TaxID=633701 RepID=UPI0028E57C1F|nr:histidine-type phosphatase [Hoylesella saccharolytica]